MPHRADLVASVPFSPLKGAAPIERYRLSNGLTVLVHEDHQAPVFAYHTWFRVGSRHERTGRTGIAHLFEHLMFKETKNLKEGEFDRVMELNGGQTNAATWMDWTYYHEKLPASKLELAVRLEADRMANMVLGPLQLDTEREVVLNERRMRVDNDPDGQAYEALYAAAFGAEHPYGWPTIGWEQDIRAITLEDCLAFYASYYAPNNATIVVVGDVDTARLLELIEEHYGAFLAHETPLEPPQPSPPAGPHRVDLELPISGDRVVSAWRSLRLDDPEIYALEVCNEVLFNSDSARLTKRLLYDDELASHASAWIASLRHDGLYQMDVTLKPGLLAEQALGVLDEEVARITTELVSEAELERARTKVEVQVVRNLLSVDSKANLLGLYETTVGSFELGLGAIERVRAVTAEDVRRVAARVFTEQGRAVLVARPEPETDEEIKETGEIGDEEAGA